MAVAYVRGVQSTGVACAVKHLVGNEQEFERMSVDVEIDERALREIYLAPFEAAVRDGGVWSVMAAYNRFRGTHCSENAPLLRGLLKEEWGFDGVVVSDYFGTHSVGAVDAGLDLEMPGPPAWLGHHLLSAVDAGLVSQEVVDDAARRMVRLILRTRIFRTRARQEALPSPPERIALARRAAAEGAVLLRNVAVIGPAAARLCAQGGGAAEVTPPYVRTPLAALAERLGADRILHEPGCGIPGPIPCIGPGGLRTPEGGAGIEVSYFPGPDPVGDPVSRQVFTRTRLIWSGPPDPALTAGRFAVRATTTFTPDRSGTWDLGLTAIGQARVLVDGRVVLDTAGAGVGGSFFTLGTDERTAGVELTGGDGVRLDIEYRIDSPGLPVAAVSLGARFRPPADGLARAVEAARRAETAVVFVGTSSDTESEGEDRATLGLPGEQDRLIRSVAAVNPRTVVVVNSGAPATMDWADEVGAVLQVWYPGQEGGDAIADVLLGEVDASGRLPTTFPRRLEDTPAFPTFPGADGTITYEESIFVGYRHYDRGGPEPRFPFGHGLSYTTFTYRSLSVERGAEGLEVGLEVVNTGSRRGSTVVQVYVRRPGSRIPRADRELKAFEKVELEPGGTGRVTLTVPAESFRHWDLGAGGWRTEEGPAEILVGESSRAIHLRATVELPGTTGWARAT
jgi:beta-glucosidase